MNDKNRDIRHGEKLLNEILISLDLWIGLEVPEAQKIKIQNILDDCLLYNSSSSRASLEVLYISNVRLGIYIILKRIDTIILKYQEEKMNNS